jgi:hypothetical protein
MTVAVTSTVIPTLSRAAIEADFAQWCKRRTAVQHAQHAARRLQMVRFRVRDPLPMSRVWFHGPKWQRAFDLQHDEKSWWYDCEPDVRERVCEEIRPGVVADWCDARERLGL